MNEYYPVSQMIQRITKMSKNPLNNSALECTVCGSLISNATTAINCESCHNLACRDCYVEVTKSHILCSFCDSKGKYGMFQYNYIIHLDSNNFTLIHVSIVPPRLSEISHAPNIEHDTATINSNTNEQ